MNRILENEIEKLINRTPNEDELKSAIEYLDGCSDDLTTSADIPALLGDWRDTCLRQCTNCGQYHLKEDMIDDEEGYADNLFCDEQCLYEWKNGYSMEQLDSEEYSLNVLK